ncbi:MATE family efflux transporter [Ostreiculturibacter nitratireducens]|uniref:MATE family efflux transporter n=1 Tax=Ostreiculturibacter nitratireducens TaxID=3075226 RepID=UPI0031B62FF4
MREPGKFLTGSLMRHVTVMSLSGTLGLGFTFLVDFLALWWISQLRQEKLIAAVGIAGTLQFAVISVAIGMMIGAVALVSRALGQGDKARARRIAATAMVLTFLAQSTVAFLAFLFRRQLLAATGAEGEVLEESVRFLAISLPSLPLIAVGMTGSAILRAMGDAWRSAAVTVTGGILAAMLDPVLILWMGWGIEGAALSIVLSRAAMAAAGLWFVMVTHDMLARPAAEDVRLFARPYFGIAIPAIATQLSTPFGNWILTRAMAEHGESAVAGWGVVLRLTILAFGGIFALSGAIGGIIGQNWGAGRADRVEGAFVAALKYCAVYALAVWALMAALSGPISDSFGLSDQGAGVVRAFNHYAAGAFIFTGALFVANATFNNLGRPLWSTAATWMRDGLLMVPLAYAMGAAAGEVGVVWAQAVANVAAGTIAAVLAWRYIGTLRRRHGSGAAPVAGE